MNLRTRIILIAAVVVVGGGVLGVGALMLKADQDAAVAQYGEAVVKICKSGMDTNLTGSVPADAKIVFIDGNTSTISGVYQPKLSAGKAATGKADVTHVGCVNTIEETYDVVEYGTTGKYKCRQFSRNLEVAFYEVKTGKQISYNLIKGSIPPTCPGKTDKSLTKYGNPPEAAEVFQVIGLN